MAGELSDEGFFKIDYSNFWSGWLESSLTRVSTEQYTGTFWPGWLKSSLSRVSTKQYLLTYMHAGKLSNYRDVLNDTY